MFLCFQNFLKAFRQTIYRINPNYHQFFEPLLPHRHLDIIKFSKPKTFLVLASLAFCFSIYQIVNLFYLQGCGYPPSVDCRNFMKAYGTEGTNFTCYVSRLNPDLVVATLDLQEVKNHLFYSLAVPIPCLLIAVFYLVIAYKFIYTDKKDKQVSIISFQCPQLQQKCFLTPT